MFRLSPVIRPPIPPCTCTRTLTRTFSTSPPPCASPPSTDHSILSLFGLSSPPPKQLPATRRYQLNPPSTLKPDTPSKGSLVDRLLRRRQPIRPNDADLGMARWNDSNRRALERTLRSPKGGVEARVTIFDSKGNVSSSTSHIRKTELCTRYGLQERDFRKLDPSVSTAVPTILVRRAAILLTMLHLRVVITANEVSLFDSVGSEDSYLKGVFIWHLENELRTKRKAAGSLPYEFRALESCLASVVTALDAEMNNIEKIISELLEELEQHIDRDKLRLLLQCSRKLSAFQKRAVLVEECLDELLTNDDDLAAMYLTDKDKNSARESSDHEEIELMLEHVSTQVEEVVSEAEGLAVNVKHTEDIIELILDANRNSLLGLDLRVSIATLGLTSGALIAGLFGMNLTSRLEEAPFAFPLISLGAFSFAGIVTLVGLAKLRKLRRIGLGYRERDPSFGTPAGSHSAHSRLRAAANAWRDQSARRGTRRRE